jgi:hypothetical protein
MDLFLPPTLSQHLRHRHLPTRIFSTAARGAAAAASETVPTDAAAEGDTASSTQTQHDSPSAFSLPGVEAASPMRGASLWSTSATEGPPSLSRSAAELKDPLLVVDASPPRAGRPQARVTPSTAQSSVDLCPICLDACSFVGRDTTSKTRSSRSTMIVSEDNEGDGGTLCLPG